MQVERRRLGGARRRGRRRATDPTRYPAVARVIPGADYDAGMGKKTIEINRRRHTVEAPEDMPLLWVLRDLLGLTGTKYGCGVGVCGSCTVLENGVAVRSCQIELAATTGKSYTTIEGLSSDGSHPIQRAWLAEDVAQCGYCQPGMMLELRSLLTRKSNPSSAEIDSALSDHVCRCGSYPRIRKAALLAARNGGGR